jgi:acyl-homoserine-lactone acylase
MSRVSPGWFTRFARRAGIALVPVAAVSLVACGGSDVSDEVTWQPPTPDRVVALPSGPEATIRRTTNGIPHIHAENLESAAFGMGYAQAQDLVCYLADAFVQARSERAKYFGPGPGDIHVINDFSYLAQGVRTGAAAEFAVMSRESRAMVRGFTAGYNKYVRETDPADLPPECRNGPWVVEIDPVDLVAHYRIKAQYASGDLFATGAVFIAVPPGVSPVPVPVAPMAMVDADVDDLLAGTVDSAREFAGARETYVDTGLASNAWGIGSGLSESGRGALLANPHFPYTGVRRFYESQVTVPGYINVRGAGLHATPLPLIGFNENLAWSHTVSTSRRFTLYEITLKDGDPLTYIKAGVEKPIRVERFEIEVNVGAPQPIRVARDFYFSEYGPMLAADAVTGGGLAAWGGTGTQGQPAAYTYRDANADTNNLLDTWLNMGRARNLGQFRRVFQECGSTLWVNTTYADDQGNAYYIDSSSVPYLSPIALAVIAAKRAASPAYDALFNAGLTLLDGDNIRDDWIEGQCNGLTPYSQKPQLLRSDFVQNSNDSFWSTNPAQPLEGYSPLYGPERSALNPRSRIGLYMLQNPTDPGFAATAPAGQDGKFGAEELYQAIVNNRSWYAEEFLDELRARCALVGAGEVNLPGGGSRSVDEACGVLAEWDGVYELDSVGAHVFRVFIADYRSKFGTHLTVPFNPADPVGTPGVPAPADPANLADDPMLVSLAAGLERLDLGGIAYDAMLGAVQSYQPSGGAPPGGVPMDLGVATPWHGGDGTIDGVFNAIGVVNSPVAEDTRLPRVNPPQIPATAGLSATPGEGWRIARGNSWHFGLEFTSSGPRGFGLISYSQSVDPDSPFFNDQARLYADKLPRPLFFTEAEIAANLLPGGEITITR